MLLKIHRWVSVIYKIQSKLTTRGPSSVNSPLTSFLWSHSTPIALLIGLQGSQPSSHRERAELEETESSAGFRFYTRHFWEECRSVLLLSPWLQRLSFFLCLWIPSPVAFSGTSILSLVSSLYCLLIAFYKPKILTLFHFNKASPYPCSPPSL